MKKHRKKIVILGAVAVAASAVFGVLVYAPAATVPPLRMESATTNGNSSTDTDVVVLGEGAYILVPEQSTITWSAGKPAIAGYVHNGSFAFQSGAVSVGEDRIAGSFVIDMQSVNVLSLGGGKEGKESMLETHLKSKDFFDTAQFPDATFTFATITPSGLPRSDRPSHVASGSLTMKGITRDITFPIAIDPMSQTEVRAVAKIIIDRTLWGVSFGSSKVVEQITDQVIGDDVELSISMVLRQE